MYKVGQELLCVKGWKNPNPAGLSITIGLLYEIVAVDMFADVRVSGGLGTTRALFATYEMHKYFLNVSSKTKSQLCDCGYVKGISAAHYTWCGLENKSPLSA